LAAPATALTTIFRGSEASMDWGLIAQWIVILGWIAGFAIVVDLIWR
jgi:hypothetical protein